MGLRGSGAPASGTSPVDAGVAITAPGYYLRTHAVSVSAPSFSTGFLRSTPLFLHKPVPIDRIGCEVTTAAGGATVALGAYAADDDGLPSDLLFSAGTIDASTTGNKEITVAETLPAGLTWLTLVTLGASVSLRSIATGAAVAQSTFPSGAGVSLGIRSNGGSNLTLPATYDATIVAQGIPPMIVVRAA